MPNTNAFTLEEINQILEQLNAHPGARLQYIGSRYVPIFGRKGEDSIEWDKTGTYEPLTIVLYQGNSYTSRQFVPAGIEITNQEYWANTGNYNAQIEQYRQEVGRLSNEVNEQKQNVLTLNNKTKYVTPEEYGALGDGIADDTLAVQQALKASKTLNIPMFGNQTYKCISSIEIFANQRVFIQELLSDSSECALTLKEGRYGHIEIENMTAQGIGIKVSNEADTVQGLFLRVGHMECANSCIDFYNKKGFLDCTLSGEGWGCDTGNGINYGEHNTEYIGQTKFDVRRIAARSGYGIKLDSANTVTTGIDFGYLSLESSQNGIWINWGKRGFERISGIFRTVEICSNSGTALKLSGNVTQSQLISLAFDYIEFDNIDISELVYALSSNLRDLVTIDSPIYFGERSLCSKAILKSKGFVFDPSANRSVTYTNSDDDDKWKEQGICPTNIAMNSPNNVLTLPSFWNGIQPMRVVLEESTTIKVKMSEDTTVSKQLNKGRYFVFFNYDASGNALITAYQVTES